MLLSSPTMLQPNSQRSLAPTPQRIPALPLVALPMHRSPANTSSARPNTLSSTSNTRLRVAAPEAPVEEERPPHNQREVQPAPSTSTRTTWWQKQHKGSEHFSELHNVEDLLQAMSKGKAENKYVVIDFFAGNCPSCKAAYPKLCSIATDDKLRETFNFYKANVQDPSLLWWVKRNSVSSIPFFMILSPQGTKVLGLSASFKRMPIIKEGMYTVQENPQVQKFGLNEDKTKIVAKE